MILFAPMIEPKDAAHHGDQAGRWKRIRLIDMLHVGVRTLLPCELCKASF